MGSSSILEPTRLRSLISDLVVCTFLHIAEALEGLSLRTVIFERESVLAAGRSLVETNLLYETGRLATTFPPDGWFSVV